MGLLDMMYYRAAHPQRTLRQREVEALEQLAARPAPPPSPHSVRCKKWGHGVALRLDGGVCVCPVGECRAPPEKPEKEQLPKYVMRTSREGWPLWARSLLGAVIWAVVVGCSAWILGVPTSWSLMVLLVVACLLTNALSRLLD